MAFRTGYGLGNYSADLYGIDSKLILGAASGAASSVVAVSYERVLSFSASASSTSSGTASGFIAIAGAASGSATGTVDLYWNRVRPFSGAGEGDGNVIVLSRYKWLDESAAPVTWTVGNYREGAA